MGNYVRVRRVINIPAPAWPLQVLLALGIGFGLFLFLLVLLVTSYSATHAGQIYPGVSVAGINLSGLSPEQAQQVLAEKITYPELGKIVFQDQSQVWVAIPAELGLYIDVQNTAQAAYQSGRSGGLFARITDQLQAWHSGVDISALLVYDERRALDYLQTIAQQVNQETIEASLIVNGLDVVVIPGQIGRDLDIQTALVDLKQQMGTLTDGLVSLQVSETSPKILDASLPAEAARKILSAPLTLRLPDAQEGDLGPWVIPPDQLAKMLIIQPVQNGEKWSYEVGLDDQALNTYLSALAPDIGGQPQNARFVFNDETRLLEVIQPAVIGRQLKVESSLQRISEQMSAGVHTVELDVEVVQPEVSDQTTGEQLGITEQVVAYTSYFRGSTADRMQNIKIAAANFHGLLVPPGAVFSMANVMGDVSLDNGYAEAWIIFGGRTIKGVGGGVCQVSTTLFRAAFFAGFPIVERYPHAYRVGYYEQTRTGYDTSLAGLDATVFVPMVDFKFQNDTPYWLLMETYFNPTARSLTWKFYSTKDGRTVDWSTTGLQNIVEPPDPLYEENPELAKGVIKQVDWAVEGADVSVTRTVMRDGQVLNQDVFTTHYMPWRDIFQYGPGTELKPKKNPRINP
ncbi:MAG TPA: VanW family protein [Anaerolineales bacterium]|nr:VanW family protein [Anaerolineales bacterium]